MDATSEQILRWRMPLVEERLRINESGACH
jgi:hypothetical protein